MVKDSPPPMTKVVDFIHVNVVGLKNSIKKLNESCELVDVHRHLRTTIRRYRSLQRLSCSMSLLNTSLLLS